MSLCWELGRAPPGGFPRASAGSDGVRAEDVATVEFRTPQGALRSRFCAAGQRGHGRVLLWINAGVDWELDGMQQQEVLQAEDGRWYVHTVLSDVEGYTHAWWRSPVLGLGELPRGPWECCDQRCSAGWSWFARPDLGCIFQLQQSSPKMLLALSVASVRPGISTVSCLSMAGNSVAVLDLNQRLEEVSGADLKERIASVVMLHPNHVELLLPDGVSLPAAQVLHAQRVAPPKDPEAGLSARWDVKEGCEHDLC